MFADEAQAGHGRFADLARKDSITAETILGESPLSGLLFRDQAGVDNHKHVAELSPVDRSSPLALAATLWTTPSQFRVGSQAGRLTAGCPSLHHDVEPSTLSWKVFVMGLDQAFERSYRDVSRGRALTAESERSSREAADRVEWRGPILPIASPATVAPSPATAQTCNTSPGADSGGSILPAVLQLGEFFLENFLDPMLGHENGGNGNSQ